jgi:hypothetical protein
MAGIKGMKQMTLYLHPDTYKLIKLVAMKTNRKVYEIVNDALVREVVRKTTPEERKTLEAIVGESSKKRRRRKAADGSADTQTGEGERSDSTAAGVTDFDGDDLSR